MPELERELSETRDYVQTLKEEYETANEEVQASNEEITATNEELQSINEELEVSKEELQSANDELRTLNKHLASRNAELNRLNSDLNNVQASLNTSIVLLGRDLTIRSFTPLAEKTFNLGVSDVGRPLRHLRQNLDFPELEQFISEVIDTLIPHEREVQSTDGHWYSLRVRPYLTLDKKIEGAVLMLIDIDAIKAKEQLVNEAAHLEQLVEERTAELTASNKQLETFVYSIAHDLRAPLRAMQSFSTMLVEEAGAALSETSQALAHRISRSAQFMDALLMDLLAFSSISQQRVDLDPVNLETIVQSALSTLENEIQEKNARVEMVGPWPTVLAHAPTVGQVLFNLVSNALKFTAPNTPPMVKIWAEEVERTEDGASARSGRGGVRPSERSPLPGSDGAHAQNVRVWVQDNGIGIAPENHEQIFGVFTRLHGKAYPGTGIGLAIVHKGVERMGGRVGLESTPGQGSCFWFELRKG